ncbi:WD40 repeat protein [Chitinophaga niastensis]|uniref:WD40 repeat protein n=2 Tax=Chitinophaga niastensis TaxID=536980 RepID=A0A2P8HGS4_CHINA|nr:WD40 repeat protein [Chitinophaga niastensis]
MKPKVAAFSGRWRDTDPFVSPDGKRLFFISNRPLEGATQDKAQPGSHIWYVDQISTDEWGTPHHIDAPINLPGTGNYAPSVSLKGTLYFCSRDREGHSGMTSYCAEWQKDHYGKPNMISFSGLHETQDPFIAPDEHYLILLSGNDLYISFHQDKDWSAPQKLGAEVNNGDSNSSPYVSPDGKTLYYSSSRIKGFYKRDAQNHAVNYDELIKENESLFNSQSNILMIPIHLPAAGHS